MVQMYILSGRDQNSELSNAELKSLVSHSGTHQIAGFKDDVAHKDKKLDGDSVGEWERGRENIFIFLCSLQN